MIFIRIIIVVAIVLCLIALFRMWAPKNNSDRCKRCDGKGYWEGTRGKETCDVCKGSGEDIWS